MTRAPYKLLDYYTYEDKDLFFGREEETRKMVGEILSTRLLILFSPSGSGKTSLINAGVRPQLEDMGYKTIYTRFEDDPIPSVCQAVSQALELPPCSDKEDLYEFVKKAAQTAGKPLVIFLDQFEEFFIVFKKEKRQPFIEQVARIKYDDQLPVFLVLSLREDYFGSLHEFREAIPSIFQNNANIRLEPFSDEEVRRAIEEPLKDKNIEEGEWRFEQGLVDTIIQDLKTDEGIEPIKLQLVCGVLWDKRPKGDSKQILLSLYKDTCEGAGKILSHFTFERLKKVPRSRHRLMVRVFEALKTPDNTKRFRSFQDLQTQLNIRRSSRLKTLVQQLSDLNVLRKEKQGGTDWYEFKHDYIVDKINNWIKERKERINRKRFLYAILPGIILFLAIFSYFFIQYHTFYATFTQPQYEVQQEEIVIIRGSNPFDERITTGLFKSDVKDLKTINNLRSELKISFWDKNNWKALADTLPTVEDGKFLYRIGQKNAGIEKLINALEDKYSYAREKAAYSLGRLGKADKSVIDALSKALKDEFYSVQCQAAYSLGRLGKGDQRVIDALSKALKDEDSYARGQVADSLGRLGKADKSVIDALSKALKDEDSYVRGQVADSLVCLGKADKSVTDALIKALEDESFRVRCQAAASLGRLGKGDKRLIDALSKALKDEDSFVRGEAADSLIRLGKGDKRVIDALIKALEDEDFDVRGKAAGLLVRLGKGDKRLIDALIKALEDKDSSVRGEAADSLIRLGKGDKRVIDALIKALEDKDSSVRCQAAASLGRLGKGDKRLIDALIKALEDESFRVRCQAADSLVRLGKGDQRVLAALIKALEDKDSSVRGEVADSLGSLGKGDQRVLAALIKALKDEDYSVRRQAADSLGILYQHKSAAELIELLKHPSSEDRTIGAHALALKKSISLQTLDAINHLKDNDERPWVKLGAWKAFELIQPRLESEEKAKQHMDEGDTLFTKGEFWEANNQYQKAFDCINTAKVIWEFFSREAIEIVYTMHFETAAHIKFQQARCSVKLNQLVDTLEHLEAAFKYNPNLKERVKNEMAEKDSEWTIIKENWYLREILLKD